MEEQVDPETITGGRMRSPRILSVRWGRMEVEGDRRRKGLQALPGRRPGMDWNETGARHSPGIQLGDVEELLAHGATSVVLSAGMNRRLQVDPRTLDFLAGRSVTVHVAETREAVKIYNDLAGSSACRRVVPLDVLTASRPCSKGFEAWRPGSRTARFLLTVRSGLAPALAEAGAG